MKVKTSISISEEILEQIDRFQGKTGNRSLFLEDAAFYYLKYMQKSRRDKLDLSKIDKLAERLNKEAKEVLSYQSDI